jgi:hypothetical protein
MFEQNQKTGRLEISDAPGNRGLVLLRDGRIVRASYLDDEGEPAFLALLELEAGHFRFLSQPVEEGGDGRGAMISPLLMEAARRRDEKAGASQGDTMH